MPSTSNQVVMDFADPKQAAAFWEWFVAKGACEDFLEGDGLFHIDHADIPDSMRSATKPGYPTGNKFYHIKFE